MDKTQQESTFVGPAARWRSDLSDQSEKLFAQMFLIRTFEEELLSRFESGQLVGTTHCYIGQEANAVGVINHLEAQDIVFSNHRCHGHFLIYGDRPDLLAAELMGRKAGLVGGRGGSQHICFRNFYSNGIQGGIAPTATGMALAEKEKKTDAVAVVFLGDGTLGQGVVYEAFNMASLWSAPILFVVENNRWAQSTPVEKELAGEMVARGRAFGMDAGEIDSTDADELFEHFGAILSKIRTTGRPHFEVIHTYRLCHHSKSDDSRPREEVESFRGSEPLRIYQGRVSEDRCREIRGQVEARVQEAFQWAFSQPNPDASNLGKGLFRTGPQ